MFKWLSKIFKKEPEKPSKFQKYIGSKIYIKTWLGSMYGIVSNISDTAILILDEEGRRLLCADNLTPDGMSLIIYHIEHEKPLDLEGSNVSYIQKTQEELDKTCPFREK